MTFHHIRVRNEGGDVREQDWRANYYEAIYERNAAEAKLQKVALLADDLDDVTGARWIAHILHSIVDGVPR